MIIRTLLVEINHSCLQPEEKRTPLINKCLFRKSLHGEPHGSLLALKYFVSKRLAVIICLYFRNSWKVRIKSNNIMCKNNHLFFYFSLCSLNPVCGKIRNLTSTREFSTMIPEACDIDLSINDKSWERAKLQVSKIGKQKSGMRLTGHESRAS